MSDGGKGDKRRPTDEDKFRQNYDAIFNKNKTASTKCAGCFTQCNKCNEEQKVVDKQE